jgi:hypothetical protein
MGLYLNPPLGGRIQNKKDWLEQHGRKTEHGRPAFQGDETSETHCYVFWQPGLHGGDNAAVGVNKTEVNRLAKSGVFEELYVVPKESLQLAGVRL